LKVLFIYKYNYIEPIGIMCLSSALKKQGHETFFFDINLDVSLFSFVDRLQPDVIAYSIITGTHKLYAELNRALKERFSFFAVFGGPHATFFPGFINEPGVDAICIGEGEEALAELVKKLEKKQPIKDVKNIYVKLNGKVFSNPVRHLHRNLDDLEFPDRALVYKYDAYRKRSNKYVLTSRGCPYNCTYCFNHSLKKIYRGKGLFCRRRSVENVMKELEELQNIAPLKRVQFFDDVFILNKKWIFDFCDAYKKNISLPFICYIRVNLLNEEIVAALKSAGVVTITFAIETGDSFLRNEVLKRRISENAILQAARLLHKYKIRFFTQNMVGLPGETIEKAFKTIQLNALCRPNYANASLFQPYPGVELTDYAIAKGYYKKDTEILHDSFYKASVLELKDKNELSSLSRLFSLGVEFSRLLPAIRLAIMLPDNILFKFIWHVTRCYGYFFRISWIDTSDIFLPFLEKIKLRLLRLFHR
jgi:anaerobic magnesium-protoporphyrin IX monomethyl ester cyclase